MFRLGRKARAKRGLRSAPVQCGAGKPVGVMWAKSLFLSVIVLGAAIAPATARGPVQLVNPQGFVPIQQQQDIRPLREVVDILRGRFGGELISARLEDGPRPVYVIRWRMPDGEVRDIRVDAVR